MKTRETNYKNLNTLFTNYAEVMDEQKFIPISQNDQAPEFVQSVLNVLYDRHPEARFELSVESWPEMKLISIVAKEKGDILVGEVVCKITPRVETFGYIDFMNPLTPNFQPEAFTWFTDLTPEQQSENTRMFVEWAQDEVARVLS